MSSTVVVFARIVLGATLRIRERGVGVAQLASCTRTRTHNSDSVANVRRWRWRGAFARRPRRRRWRRERGARLTVQAAQCAGGIVAFAETASPVIHVVLKPEVVGRERTAHGRLPVCALEICSASDAETKRRADLDYVRYGDPARHTFVGTVGHCRIFIFQVPRHFGVRPSRIPHTDERKQGEAKDRDGIQEENAVPDALYSTLNHASTSTNTNTLSLSPRSSLPPVSVSARGAPEFMWARETAWDAAPVGRGA